MLQDLIILYYWSPKENRVVILVLLYLTGGEVGFAIPKSSGGYVAGKGKQLVEVDWESGSSSVVHEVEHRGSGSYRFNDAKCDPSGRLWAGTMVWPPEDTGHAVLYSIDKDKDLKLKCENLHLSNGLAWTADKKAMFLIDTGPRKIYAFNFDVATGDLCKCLASSMNIAVHFLH